VINKIINRFKLAGHVLVKGRLPRHTRGVIPPISSEEVAEARIFFPLDKFFVFGHARSGTTLLTRLVRLHPDVHCNYQGHFFTRLPTIEGLVNTPEIESWFIRRSNRWNRGRDLSPVVMRVAVDFIMEREARMHGVKVVGDKSPNSLLDGAAVDLLHKVYPDGKLVFIVRDGRDAAISHRFQTFIDATQHLDSQDWEIRAAFERDPDPFLRGERSVFTPKGIRSAAEGWSRNVSETHERGKVLFGTQYLSLRYEDLLANPRDQMSRIWEFLGEDFNQPGLFESLESELESNPDRDWQRKKAGDLASSLQKGKMGSWREIFTDRDKYIFHQVAGKALTAWKYGEI
jgi:hypothetical protein